MGMGRERGRGMEERGRQRDEGAREQGLGSSELVGVCVCERGGITKYSCMHASEVIAGLFRFRRGLVKIHSGF